MSDELTVRIPDWTPPATLGVNSHKHWRAKHGPEQTARDLAFTATKNTIARAAWACPDMPVLVAIVAWEKRSRRKDADNTLNCLKHSIDGMCAALGIDDKRFITAMAFQRLDEQRRGYVELTIRPATAAERKLAA